MVHVVEAGLILGGAGGWLRWSATAAVIAYGLGRKVERIRRQAG